jgi:hypothetical protein
MTPIMAQLLEVLHGAELTQLHDAPAAKHAARVAEMLARDAGAHITGHRLPDYKSTGTRRAGDGWGE